MFFFSFLFQGGKRKVVMHQQIKWNVSEMRLEQPLADF